MAEELNSRNKLDLLRSLCLGITTAAALGSWAFTLQAGLHNGSAILNLLFSVWILSPFIVLMIAGVMSKRWPTNARISLYILMMVISLFTLLFYGGLLSFSDVRLAAVFLVIPFFSWILMLTALAFLSR